MPKYGPLPASIRLDQCALWNTVRTSGAAVASLLIARCCGLSETYWAVITTIIIVTQPTLGVARNVSLQRLAGTMLGGVTALVLVRFFAPGVLALAVGMMAMGLICAALLPRQDSAYRFAGITLVVVMMINRGGSIGLIALHRFLEVTLGIVVGMLVTAVFPDRLNRAPDTEDAKLG